MIDLNIGQHVIYVDPRGRERSALVTAVHAKEWHQAHGTEVGVNVAFIADEDAQRDDYGRKVHRETSVVHQSVQPASGNYWKLP